MAETLGENEFCAYTDKVTLATCPLPPTSGWIMENLPLFPDGFLSFIGVCQYHKAELKEAMEAEGIRLIELFGEDLRRALMAEDLP